MSHSPEGFHPAPHDPSGLNSGQEMTPLRRQFLEERYLREEYIVPPDVRAALASTSDALTVSQPGFVSLVNVGGTANGSLELRRLEGGKTASDLDYYLIGHRPTLDHLRPIGKAIRTAARTVGLEVDPDLSARGPEIVLDLDDMDGHIQRGEFNLMALPFQSTFGDVRRAQATVLQAIIANPDKETVWDEVASYHIQSLSMHHGSWSSGFNNAILEQYYPQKIARFEFPPTPEEALASLAIAGAEAT